MVNPIAWLETLKAQGQQEETATSQISSQLTGWNFPV